jgi:hypothetical protein
MCGGTVRRRPCGNGRSLPVQGKSKFFNAMIILHLQEDL